MYDVTARPTNDQKMARRDSLKITNLGEWYEDLLRIEAWITGRTMAAQGSSLLCAKLQEREKRSHDRVAYLAKKRGLSKDELWFQILKGEASAISPGEIVDIADEDDEIED